jgi:hypothetical protein
MFAPRLCRPTRGITTRKVPSLRTRLRLLVRCTDHEMGRSCGSAQSSGPRSRPTGYERRSLGSSVRPERSESSRLALAVVLAAVALLSSACGESATESPTAATGSTLATGGVPPTTPTSPTTLTAGSGGAGIGRPVITEDVRVRSTNGYTADLSIDVYAPARGASLPALPYSHRSQIAACNFDQQADVAIPIAIKITNTTPSFSSPLNLDLSPDTENLSPQSPYAQNIDVIDADFDLSSGPACYSASGATTQGHIASITWADGPAPRSNVWTDFFLIGHGYFSPAHPTGDPTFFRGFEIIPALWFGATGNETPSVGIQQPVSPFAVTGS